MPRLRFSIITLYPIKQEYLPLDYDGVTDRKNDIIYHERTEFDENVAVLMSDLATLAKSLITLAEENGVNKNAIEEILNKNSREISFSTGKQERYDDLLRSIVDVDFVARLERKNDNHRWLTKYVTCTTKFESHDPYHHYHPYLR